MNKDTLSKMILLFRKLSKMEAYILSEGDEDEELTNCVSELGEIIFDYVGVNAKVAEWREALAPAGEADFLWDFLKFQPMWKMVDNDITVEDLMQWLVDYAEGKITPEENRERQSASSL